jgi:Trm5-related predicted tRNA methylase
MNTKIEKRLHKVKQRLNRYQCQRTRYLRRRGETAMQFRKARTRTLIQLGGLVDKSGLLEPLNITLGDDLQKDYGHLESTAILTGAC